MPGMKANKPYKLDPKLVAEIDTMHGGDPRRIVLTEEQKAILIYMRDRPSPISWTSIAKFWKSKGWDGTRSYLRRAYEAASKGD